MNPQSTPEPESSLMEAEIQHSIPVKQHADDKNGSPNPINSFSQPAKNDNDLDKVLKDVNKSIKETSKKPKKIWFQFHKKLKVEKASQSNKTPDVKEKKTTKPSTVIAAAVVVAVGLSIIAVYAFGQSNNNQKNQASGTTPSSNSTQQNAKNGVTAADLSTLSSDLNTTLESLDDSQDFNATDLSDQNLGL
jgi:uncharacterized protein HemX